MTRFVLPAIVAMAALGCGGGDTSPPKSDEASIKASQDEQLRTARGEGAVPTPPPK